MNGYRDLRFDDFVARPALIENLRKAFGSGRVSHAYLFTGPAGSGKKTMADICVRALYCTGPEESRPCGTCESCRGFAEWQGHSDIYYLDVDEGRTQIRVENVRDIAFALSDSSSSGGKRCVICRQAEKMKADAQDALLKTLEEPPPNTVFILCAENVSQLLPTVVSRCMPVQFSPVGDRVIRERVLEGRVPAQDMEWILELAAGLPGRAFSLIENGSQSREIYLNAMKALTFIREGKGIAAAAKAVRCDKADAQDALYCFEILGRKLLKNDNKAGIALLDAVCEARSMLRSNVTWQYVLDTLLIRAAEG